MKRLSLFLLVAVVFTPVCFAAEGWTDLFDGKTLDGWKQHNGKATYAVEDGTITGRTAKNSPNSFLCSDKAYADFELLFEVKDDNGLNSGVQIRSRSSKDYNNERVHGPQVEIEKAPGDSGYIYSEGTGRGWLSKERPVQDVFKNNEWNQYRVLAVGPRIQTWINGKKVEDITDKASSKAGFIGLQVHGVGAGGPFKVQWRNIKIKDLSPQKTKEIQGIQFTPAPDTKKK